jgi:hypothetical protein
MPFLIAALTFAKDNWKAILIVLLIVGLFGFGYHTGHKSAEADCTAKMVAEHNDFEKRRQELQEAADKSASDYEKERTAHAAQMDDINRRLADVQKANSSFSTCHSGAAFMQLYTDTAVGRSGR